ncbi:MAG TPA: PilN domain-containing protein [Methylocystis sp.]|nr:PilN domain-containing protein [Methylocystis sp.]
MASFADAFKNRRLFEGELATAARRGWALYKVEFCACFSKETLSWLFDRGDHRLVLRGLDASRELRFRDNASAPLPPILAAELVGSSLEAALARRGVARDAANIVLEMPRELFFVRRFDIPAAAEQTLPQLLQADIERKTPFRAADVIHGHALSRRADAPGKIAVQLWLLRRDIVTRALEGSGLGWDDLDALASERADAPGEEAPVIALGRHGEPPQWFRKAAMGLAAAAVLLFALGAGILAWRQDTAEKDLDERIAELSKRAGAVRKTADEAVAQSSLLKILHEERDRGPSFADIWEEVSRILPDGAYLTELRLSEEKPGERQVDLVGFADSAVGLPALFDKSPMFAEASLTAPITPNAQDKKEAFSLRARVRQKPAEGGK